MKKALKFPFLFGFFAFTSAGASAAIELIQPFQPKSIDVLQTEVTKKFRSKSARTLKSAYAALKEKKYSNAIQLSSKVIHDTYFKDYALWIKANAQRGLAENFLKGKKTKAALDVANQSIAASLMLESHFPYSPFMRDLPKEIAQTELVIGEAYWSLKNWSQSQLSYERAFQRLQTKASLLQLSPDHLDHYAQSCKQKAGVLCASWLQKFVLVFVKKSPETIRITKYFPELESISLKSVNLPVSKVTIGYRASDLDYVAFEKAMRLYIDEQYEDCIKEFRQFLDTFPRSGHRYRAKFWLAQALTQKQEHEKATQIYEDLRKETPLSYYGLMASNAIGKPVESLLSSSPPLAVDVDQGLFPAEVLHLKRANHFIAENAYDLAGIELSHHQWKMRSTVSSPFLVYLAMLNSKSKNYRESFQLVGELLQRGYEGMVSSYGVQQIFPVNHLNVINKYAEEYKLDPLLVLSLIKQESAFTEDVFSSVGAMGLMQLMPATALDTDPKVTLTSLLSAEENIRVGAKYLKKLIDRFNGNVVLALAGYNAGPTAAARWAKEAAYKKGMLEFIESIPYRETREYVGSIIRNYYWYSKRLGGAEGTPPKLYEKFWEASKPQANSKQDVLDVLTGTGEGSSIENNRSQNPDPDSL